MIIVTSALLMLVGIIGIVLPILPGLLLVWGGVALWAIAEASLTGWIILSLATIIIGSGLFLEVLVPGKRMRNAGVATSTLLVAVVVGIGFAFVIPVVGFFLGFPLGIYLVQLTRMSTHSAAWDATKHALKAIGLNILIELLTAISVIAIWITALWMT